MRKDIKPSTRATHDRPLHRFALTGSILVAGHTFHRTPLPSNVCSSGVRAVRKKRGSMRTFLFVLVLALIPAICVAGITIDMTGAVASVKDSQTISVQHVTVPGFGIYAVEIKWNPDTIKFDVSVATAETSIPNPYPSNTYPLASSIATFSGAYNIDGEDMGTILSLSNGQLWQVTTVSVYGQVNGTWQANSQAVTIYSIQGGYTMSFDGRAYTVSVRPFTYLAKIDSSIANFSGAYGGTILRLANGQAWQVVSGSAYLFSYPNPLPVTIYQLSSTKYVMSFGGYAGSAVVARIN